MNKATTFEVDSCGFDPNEPSHSDRHNNFFRLRNWLAALFLRAAERLEAHPVLAFLLLLVVFVPEVLGRSLAKPLWHDELFTFYISQSPSLSTLLRDTRLVDLNPPLSYLLTKTCFLLFGVNTLSTRLPEMAGFLLAMGSLFLFVRRRAGTLYGLAAAVLLYSGVARDLIVEARPYGLLLGFSALSLLAWQRARAKEPLGIPLLLLGGFGILLSHVFSVFVWAALAAAEGLCILRRRRIDWPLAMAWTLPLISVVTYVPLLRSHGTSIFPPDFQPNISAIMQFYVSSVAREMAFLILTGLVMIALVGRRLLQAGSGWLLTPPEWASVIFVLAAPLALIFELMHSHAAFFNRYGTFASVAISVLATALLAWWARRDLRAALVCIVIALLISGQVLFAGKAVLHQHLLTATEPAVIPCEACTRTAKLDASLPLVDASGLTFLEMDHREDAATLQRVFYLTDAAASAKYAHANIFEGMPLEKALFPIRANVSSYADFLQHHRHFFVLGNYDFPEDWLLRKLQDDGATLRMLGTTENSYKSKDLYEVSFEEQK